MTTHIFEDRWEMSYIALTTTPEKLHAWCKRNKVDKETVFSYKSNNLPDKYGVILFDNWKELVPKNRMSQERLDKILLEAVCIGDLATMKPICIAGYIISWKR